MDSEGRRLLQPMQYAPEKLIKRGSGGNFIEEHDWSNLDRSCSFCFFPRSDSRQERISSSARTSRRLTAKFADFALGSMTFAVHSEEIWPGPFL